MRVLLMSDDDLVCSAGNLIGGDGEIAVDSDGTAVSFSVLGTA